MGEIGRRWLFLSRKWDTCHLAWRDPLAEGLSIYPLLAHGLVAAGFGASKGSRTVGGAVGKARCSPDSTLRTEEEVVREGQVGVLHSLSCPSPPSALPDNR